VFNRRIGKAVDTTSPFNMADAEIERYVYDDVTGVASLDGGNVVLDFVDPDGDGATTIDLERRYLYGAAVDQILAQEDVTESTGSADRVYWPLVDHLGTVRDLAKNDGTLGEHYEYDSYGNIVSGDTSKTRYLFTSREYDADTGLQYNRARWYDAEVGRWVSEDPIGFAAGDGNLARYVGNNPAALVDPSGLDSDAAPAVDYATISNPIPTPSPLSLAAIAQSEIYETTVTSPHATVSRTELFSSLGSRTPPAQSAPAMILVPRPFTIAERTAPLAIPREFASNRPLADHAFGMYLNDGNLAGVVWLFPFRDESGVAASLTLENANYPAERALQWVQIARSTTNGSTDYERGVPSALYTRPSHDGHIERGFVIDVVYSPVVPGVGEPASNIYFDAHHNESIAANGLGFLVDYPHVVFFGMSSSSSTFEFESYLVDSQANQVVGGISWGFTVNHPGHAGTYRLGHVQPYRPSLIVNPSPTFEQAVDRANDHWETDYNFFRRLR
jgi:RHS repeat-associated protein